MLIERILVVKLSDIGDVLTATPALRALRQSFPAARLDVLLPPHSAPVLEGSPLADELITFEKSLYDRPLSALRPENLAATFRLGLALRRRGYDHFILLHHLTTRWGAMKFAALALVSGAKRRIGLDNGRGWFLTDRIEDRGFGHKHEVEYCLEVVGRLGAETEDRRLEIAISPADENLAEEKLRGFEERGKPLIAIHPGTGGYIPARRWMPERFARVAEALAEGYGAKIVLVGREDDGVAEVETCMKLEVLNLAGKTTLKELAALLRRCHLFIGADSGVMHLAAAAGVPVVALFGPTNPAAWGPWGTKSVVVRAGLHCSPCSYVDFRLSKGCLMRECIEAITPEMVLEAVGKLEIGS
ncbi:MAG: lipopolysaccharide heptosyltransferase II [Anaerolineae bacterium]